MLDCPASSLQPVEHSQKAVILPDRLNPTALEDRCAPNLGSYFNECFERAALSPVCVITPPGVDGCEQQSAQSELRPCQVGSLAQVGVPAEGGHQIYPSVAGGGLKLCPLPFGTKLQKNETPEIVAVMWIYSRECMVETGQRTERVVCCKESYYR